MRPLILSSPDKQHHNIMVINYWKIFCDLNEYFFCKMKRCRCDNMPGHVSAMHPRTVQCNLHCNFLRCTGFILRYHYFSLVRFNSKYHRNLLLYSRINVTAVAAIRENSARRVSLILVNLLPT